ncbi:MAG: cytochrome P450 [Mycobacterium sp.]
MPKSLEDHAENFDLRHEDFKDPDFLYELYSHMRDKTAITHTDFPFLSTRHDGAWLAMTYDECYEILRDWETFSSTPPPGDVMQLSGDVVILLDPPRQQALRKVLNPYFSPGRMKQLQPQIRAETDALINEFIEDGRGDLAVVAWQQPGIVFFKYLLGMPVGDVPLCIELTDTALNGETEQIRLTAWGGLYQHITNAVTTRMQGEPQDDMIDVLLSAEIDGVKLQFDDVVSNAMLLVQAGLETTASAMSCAFHYLGSRPDERDRLIHEPDLMPTAVEELIRFAGSIHGIPRTVTKEVEIGGQNLCPGQSVIVNYASANRDDREFPDAHRCILDRQTNRHLGFGAGVHRCLGSNLARLEFRIGVEQTLARMPNYTVATDAESIFHGNSVTRGFRKIPVEFTPGPRVQLS